MKKIIKGYQKGSYTIEASLLMGIILPVLFAIIYLTFALHDKAFIQGAAHEAACAYSLHSEDGKKERNIESRLISGKLLGTRNVNASASDGKKKVQIHYQGTMSIPSFVSTLFGKSSLVMDSSVTLTTQKPTVLIQKLRGAAKIVDRIRGD